jgi:DNA-binding transcriptional LysR family regulator
VVDLRQVQAFVVLAGELHFGRTADRLYLTPSRVSRLIAALEREVGGALFERSSRRVALTPLGAEFLAELAPAHAALTRALCHARASARGAASPLRVGFTITTGGYLLNRLARRFEAAHPESGLTLHEVPIEDPFGLLRSAGIDVLAHWVLDPVPGLTCGAVLGSHRRMLAVAADSPLAAAPSLPAEVLGDWLVPDFQPISERIRKLIIPERTPAGRAVRRHPSPVATIPEGISMVARGVAVWPTVDALAQITYGQGIALIPLDDLPPLELGLYWLGANQDARLRALATTAQALARGNSRRHRAGPPS